MTLLVRDEEDIVAHNLDYHYAQGVDFVIATDNNSVDSTPSILKRYVASGRLRLIEQTDDTYDQTSWVTTMARLAAREHGADWVINNDADEFWWPAEGDLKTTLAKIPWWYGVVRCPRVNFPPVSDEEEPFYQRMTVREVVSLNGIGRPIVPKVCHRARRSVVVRQGNHVVAGRWLRPSPAQPITIFHFPLRSYSQFENKINKGGAAYERNTSAPSDVGMAWRELYKHHKEGRLYDHYALELLTGERAEQGLTEGRYVVDERLRNFIDRQPRLDGQVGDGPPH